MNIPTMEVPKIIIAVDGYSSTGKSTFAKMIAEKLGFIHLDSGAIYRAVTLFALRSGFIDYRNHIDEYALLEALPNLNISMRPEIHIGKENVEEEIRQMDVSNSVSPVSALPFVRTFVDNLLREYGNEGGIVMDGRDIGTNVFPNAQLKIFMTASAEVRAKRRYDEMLSSGKHVDFKDVLRNIQDRDFLDTHRSISPLRKADDALVLDNSNMTMTEQFAWLGCVLKDRLGISI